MPRKHHKPEEIVAKLRQVDVLTSQGKSVSRCDPSHRRHRGDVLSLASGVRRAEERSGQADEGFGGREHPSSARRL
jgi:hypothetical protein